MTPPPAVPSFRSTVHLSVLLLAACQPEARRLLVLDLARTDPVVVEATARPWLAVGYHVRYRPFYPHLTAADLGQYHAVLILGGRAPEHPGDALTAADLVLLSEWAAHGRAIVLGYAGDGEGSQDRSAMNRWLTEVGAGIEIDPVPLADPVQRVVAGFEPQPPAVARQGAPLRNAGLEPFPAGRNHALRVADERHVLARSAAAAAAQAVPGPPVVAATRLGPGLVVVASRHALAALGADLRPATTPLLPPAAVARTRTFLVALARWTRRPAEWAGVPPARQARPLGSTAALRSVTPGPPPAVPPPGARARELTAARARAPRPQAPRWIARDGVRLLWSDQPAPRAAGLDSMVAFLEVGAFNALATIATPLAADSLRAKSPGDSTTAPWRETARRLAQTSVRWFPAIPVADLATPPDTAGLWCALDPRLWDAFGALSNALIRLAAESPDVVTGIAVDLTRRTDLPGDGLGPGRCDATYTAVLAALALDSAQTTQLDSLPRDARYAAVLHAGLLAGYYGVLEHAVGLRAAAMARAARRASPQLLLAVRTTAAPGDWLSIGFLRGFAVTLAPSPVLLWSHEVRSRELAAGYRRRGAAVLHAVGLSPRFVPPGAWPRLRSTAFSENDGFWIAAEDVATDSLARLVRRLAR